MILQYPASWRDFKLRLITSITIKLIGFIGISIGVTVHWLLNGAIGDFLWIADTIGFVVIVGPAVFMTVGAVFAHASRDFCYWFWQKVTELMTVKEPGAS